MEAAPIPPPDPDLVLRAGLARLLAAYWDCDVGAPRVVWVGRLLWRVFRWAARREAGTAQVCTVTVSAADQITVYALPEWVD